MSAAWMVGPKGGLVRVPSDRPAPQGCTPLTSPAPLGNVPPGSTTPTPPRPAAPEETMSTPPPSVELVPLTPEERKALTAMPSLVVQLMRALDVMTAGPSVPTSTPRSDDASLGVEPVDLVPHPLNPSAAPIPRALAAELLAQRPAAVPPPPAPVKSVGEHLAEPVPTLDELRAACARAAARLGGNPAALARMATFGAKRVGDVPEAKRALFVRYMDGDDAAKV